MTRTVRVRDAVLDSIAAVAHVDQTARPQTVTETTNPLFHALIEAFRKRTGLPLVLNTSFNLDGRPIVETPDQAFECLLATQIDALALGPFLVTRARP
jgi:predicted NodU family carbamoyl transferase